MLRRRGVRKLAAGAVIGGALLTLVAPEAGAQDPPTGFGRGENCISVDGNPKVPAENIQQLVPDDFTLEPDPNNLVTLSIGGTRCERLTITRSNGESSTRESTWAAFRVPLSEAPEGEEDLGETGQDLYQLWLVSDNPDLIDLLRDEGGEEARGAVFVPNMAWNLDFGPTETETDFTLDVPPPAPSPFRMEATVGRPVLGPIPVFRLRHFSTNQNGWMVIDGNPGVMGVFLGKTEDGHVEPRPGSQLDRVFCNEGEGGSFANPEGTASILRDSFEVTLRQNRPTEPTPPAMCPAPMSA